jgi:hypothetical protein
MGEGVDGFINTSFLGMNWAAQAPDMARDSRLLQAVSARSCRKSRLPHFLDNRLTDGGEVVNLRRRPPFTHSKIPGTHFC